MTSPIQQALALGQSIWYDNIRRSLITSGELERMVREDGLRGVTSNPSIFEKAIAGSSDYSDAIADLRRSGSLDAKSAYESLAIADVRAAADILRSVYDESGGDDGYVSMEVSPELARDTAGTIAEAKRLWATVDRPNLMVKVPGTPEGIPAIQELIGAAINVNVTLLFGMSAYESALRAYLAGLEDRLVGGGGIAGIASVASVFVSRLDSAIESRLDSSLSGKVAIANAKVIYQRSREILSDSRWAALAAAGARPQRLLWASTSTKNPSLPELCYVESLIGEDTVDTIPPSTYEAFVAHGSVHSTLNQGVEEARALLDSLPGAKVEMSEVLEQLLLEGLEKFSNSYRELLAAVEKALVGESGHETWRLRRSLPEDLDEAVERVIDEWRATNKVARIWAHDPTVWTSKGEEAWLGWLGVALDQEAHAHRFVDLAKDVQEARFSDVVVLGMGGSSLCPDVLAHSFPAPAGYPRLQVLDSTDPAQVKAIEESIDLPHTLFFVSSKSGTTLEPNIFAAYFFEKMSQAVGVEDAKSHFVAITDPGSALEAWARTQGYRGIFYGVPSIGGRYSALSDFGMVPGAASGVDVARLFASAEAMAHACAPTVPAQDNPGLELGAVIGSCVNAGRDKVTLLASPGVAHLGAWLEQLLAESTGKEGKGVVPVDREPLGEPLVYGTDRLFAYIYLKGDNDTDQELKVVALEEAGQAVVRIELSDPYDLGREFFRWEFATAVAGSVIGINPFDQPDVEEAKVLTRELTDRYDQTGTMSEDGPFFANGDIFLYASSPNQAELESAVGSRQPSIPSSLEAYLGAHLVRAKAGDYVALLAYVQMSPAHEEILTEIRTLIRGALKVATCVGFGPRFQHSTGQAYKGGPNTGVILQITCDESEDLAVPGHRFSFGVVKDAQARGDFEAMDSRGRRALRVHLGAQVNAGLHLLRAAVTTALLGVEMP